jgi:hypothetical protein
MISIMNDCKQPIIPAISPHSAESIPSPVEPTLSKAQVEAKWGFVLQRIKRQKDRTLIVVLLRGYSIVDVKNTEGVPLIILKAPAPLHYETVKKRDTSQLSNYRMGTTNGAETNMSSFLASTRTFFSIEMFQKQTTYG